MQTCTSVVPPHSAKGVILSCFPIFPPCPCIQHKLTQLIRGHFQSISTTAIVPRKRMGLGRGQGWLIRKRSPKIHVWYPHVPEKNFSTLSVVHHGNTQLQHTHFPHGQCRNRCSFMQTPTSVGLAPKSSQSSGKKTSKPFMEPLEGLKHSWLPFCIFFRQGISKVT